MLYMRAAEFMTCVVRVYYPGGISPDTPTPRYNPASIIHKSSEQCGQVY